ncbi:non-ribosomal peptide synthetase [Streptomyces cellulosae]|uniref:non-ribosomal peptide synthetase n=1 Tax=Streptomyces cellulosae TaxID=1968 RepID=UPI00068A3C1C|nr:amino acid adenylation domain-containing protein [Streptomyces cellulosae]
MTATSLSGRPHQDHPRHPGPEVGPPPETSTAGCTATVPRWRAPHAGGPGAGTYRTTLPSALAADLERTARALGTDLPGLLLTAHARVLATLTSERGVLSGHVPPRGSSPRTLRLTIDPSTWAELAGAVSLAPETTPGATDAVLDLSGLTTGVPGHGPGAVVRFAWARGPDGLTLHVTYDLGAFDGDHAARLAGYQLTALRLLAEDPSARHDRRSLLSPEETATQLYQLAGPRDDPPDLTFVDLFRQRVRERPGAPAAAHGDRTWTYRELDERSDRVARALTAAGAGAEDVVAVVMDRTLDWIASAIGVLKAGAVYLPMPHDLPVERVAVQLDEAVCVLALTDHHCESLVRKAAAELDGGLPVLTSDHIRDVSSEHPLPGPPAPAQAAYIYFTSGSTGTPKGALCEHAGLVNHLHAKIDDMGLAGGRGQVVAQTASAGFDISLWQFAAPLLAGGITRIIDTDVMLDVSGFLDELVDRHVTVAQTVPAYLDVLLRHLERHPRDLGALHTLSVTGEVLDLEPVRRWFAAHPGIRLVNAYGATEVCDDTMHEILDGVPERGFVPLGRPLRNVTTYVLDHNLELVPLGTTGEIAFSGVCVGRGYINDEERTRQAFVPDPFRAHTRMYRSGDFGRWLPDGRLEFLGRHDEQVKIRGYRIELGEIEHRLAAMPGVRDVAVVIDGDLGATRTLVAFFTTDETDTAAPDTAARARDFLATRLPDYMVPTYCHRLEHLPLTANGKVDKAALAGLAGTLGHGGVTRTAPATPDERRLAVAWAEVLGVPLERIGKDDSFFSLGGTSLAAARLIAHLGRRLTVADLVAHPVLADLARVLTRRRDGEPRRPHRHRLLHPLLPVRSPHHTLVCFPYAAGNAVNYRALAQELERDGVAVYGAEPPGHDFAAPDEPLLDVPELARRARDEILAHLTTPVLLWGHCAGAAAALETARLLEAAGRPVERVFLGAQLLPDAEALRAELTELAVVDRRTLLGRLRGGHAYVELDAYQPERAEVADRAYRHDVDTSHRHLIRLQEQPHPHRLAAPVDVVVARDDPQTTDAARAVGAWRTLAERVTLHELDDGGHYFIGTRPALSAARIRETTTRTHAQNRHVQDRSRT